MYTFLEREDGFLVVHENERAVAHVDTKVITETNDPRLKAQEQVVTPLAKDQWRVHFTGYKFTPQELAMFLKELAAQ